MDVLGIDVAKATLVVVLLMGERQQRAEFANTPAGHAKLLSWLAKRSAAPVHACLEATGTYGDDLAQALYDAGHTVSVVNPARIAAYATVQAARHKTDQADAALIARYCQREQPAAWSPPPRTARVARAGAASGYVAAATPGRTEPPGSGRASERGARRPSRRT